MQNVISMSKSSCSYGDSFSSKVIGKPTIVEGQLPYQAPCLKILTRERESSEAMLKHKNFDAADVNIDQKSCFCLLTELNISGREGSALEPTANGKEGSTSVLAAEPQINFEHRIVVWDAHYFHHFEHIICSCGDY